MSDHAQLRILIVRLGAMGDILHALPAVTALRAAHPEWHLGWAVEPQWRALLASETRPGERPEPRTPSMPLVDAIHPVPAKHWGRHPLAPSSLRSILATRRELRQARYEIALDLQGAIRSALIARWGRPARLIGEAVPREPLARHLFSERVTTTGVHVIEQAAELVRALASEPFPIELPALPYDAQAGLWCDQHAPSEPFVLLSPGAGWGAKRWPVERYAEVAGRLVEQGRHVVMHTAPTELLLAEQFAAFTPRPAAGSLVPHAANALPDEPGITLLTPNLHQLIELSRRAALVIAGDTGPLHLAAALGCPTVAIFGPTDPARNGPFHGQAEGRNIILRHPESRRDHSRREAPEAGLLTITTDEVLAAAETLLAREEIATNARQSAHSGAQA